MMAAAEAGKIDVVLVNSISRISRSICDLDATVDWLEDEWLALHIIDESISIEPGETEDPYQRAINQLLDVFTELEVWIGRKRTWEEIAAQMEAKDDYHHGRAPLGFESEDGKLYPTENYDHIGSLLELVRNDELSKRKAADELNTSRKTIDRALDRGELYRL
jgi:DNA invertase Pin-like site-specific DNA recombinase